VALVGTTHLEKDDASPGRAPPRLARRAGTRGQNREQAGAKQADPAEAEQVAAAEKRGARQVVAAGRRLRFAAWLHRWSSRLVGRVFRSIACTAFTIPPQGRSDTRKHGRTIRSRRCRGVALPPGLADASADHASGSSSPACRRPPG